MYRTVYTLFKYLLRFFICQVMYRTLMAFTRFKYDDARTKKELQQATGAGRWVLNVPGNGDAPAFMEDPHIGLQKWGANLMTHALDLENELRGGNRPLNRDCLDKHQFQQFRVSSAPISYPTNSTLTTEQSRATHPAWWYKDLEQRNWEYPPLNPQVNVCLPFHNNLSTRILEKDAFTPKRDCVMQETKQLLPASHALIRGSYVGGPTTCAQNNTCSTYSI